MHTTEQWRDIRTAPKTGETIRVWRRNRVELARYNPTHQLKLPNPFWERTDQESGAMADRLNPPQTWLPHRP